MLCGTGKFMRNIFHIQADCGEYNILQETINPT